MKDFRKGVQSIGNIKSKLLALLLSFTMLSTGCGSTINNEHSENYNNDNPIQDEVVDELNIVENTDELNILGDVIESTPMNISERFVENKNMKEIAQDYIEAIKDIKPTYNHEEYFLTQEELDSIMKSVSNDVKCSNVIDSDRKAAIDKLVDQIYQNSVEFVVNNPEYKLKNNADKEQLIPSSYLGYDENLGYDLKYFLKSTLTSIFENATNDINEDFCLLSEIRVVFSSDTPDGSLGNYDRDNNQINIYYQNFDLPTDATILDFWDEIKETGIHEFNHVRQYKCNHRLKNKEYESISYSDKVTTLMETSAESVLYNQRMDDKYLSKSTYDYTYLFQRRDEALLLLIGITNTSIDDYYNAIFDSNPKALYNYFQLDSDDIETFYRILYSIDTRYFCTNLSFDMFPEMESSNVELSKILGYDYRVDIFKLALKNLAKYTSSHPDFSLKDNLTLFNLIKNALINNMYWLDKDDEGREIYDNDIISLFPYLEESYVEFISKTYNVSIDEIRKIERTNYSYLDLKNAVKEIITKFPVLNAILYSEIYIFGYDDFVRDNNLSLKTSSHN